MKIIKFSHLLLVAFFFISLNSFSQSLINIGKVSGGVHIITVSTSDLLHDFEASLLSEEGINGNFTAVAIINIGGDYFLRFNGSSYSSTVVLTTNGYDTNGDLIIACAAAETISCTTSECASQGGCNPVGSVCSKCSNDGKCTRTTTAYSMMFPNL